MFDLNDSTRKFAKLEINKELSFTFINGRCSFDRISENWQLKIQLGDDELEWRVTMYESAREINISAQLLKSIYQFKVQFSVGLGNRLVVEKMKTKNEILAEGSQIDRFIPRNQFNSFSTGKATIKIQLNLESFAKSVASDILRLLEIENEGFADFVINTNDDTSLKAHKAVLAIRSPYFMAILTSGSLNDEVDVAEFDSVVMNHFLRFIYSGSISDDIKEGIAKDLIKAAQMYKVNKLIELCADSLSRCVTIKNVIDLTILARNLNNEGKLFQKCLDVWFENYPALMENPRRMEINRDLMDEINKKLMNRKQAGQ